MVDNITYMQQKRICMYVYPVTQVGAKTHCIAYRYVHTYVYKPRR
jgi:hypothetical protein